MVQSYDHPFTVFMMSSTSTSTAVHVFEGVDLEET